MTARQERYGLGPLADFMAEDILSTPGRKLVEEVTEDCGDPEALASAFDKIVHAELPDRADKPARSSVGLGRHRIGQSSLSSEPLLSRWRRTLSVLSDIVFPNRLVMALISAQLTKLAVALALLLGVGSVGFYFAKDFNSPPVNVATSTSPDLTPRVPAPHEAESKPGSVPRPNRPPTDSRERTTEFLTAYDGGDCFFITPERLSDDPQTRDVDGLGSADAPFDILSHEFQRQFGFDAAIGLHRVRGEQCPAVNFLFRTRNQPGTAPRLDIVAAGLTRAPPVLSGFVAALGDRHVELLLITEDGYVLSATEDLKPTSNGKTFTVKLDKAPGPPEPQLVFAIASSKPLEALNLPPGGSRAEQVFARVLTEASQRGLTFNVSAKYFILGKGAAEAKRKADEPPAPPIAPPPPVVTAPGPALADAHREQEEQTVWDRIKGQDDVAALRDFVNKYPSSPYAIISRNRLELLERLALEREEDARRSEGLRREAGGRPRAEQLAAQKRADEEQKRQEALHQQQEEQARVATLQQHEEEKRQAALAAERQRQEGAAAEKQRQDDIVAAEQRSREIQAAIAAALAAQKQPELAAPNPPVDYGRRVALVISNAQYRTVGRSLPNAAADGEAIAAALRDTGFQDVVYQHDLTRSAMLAALHRFQEQADQADWAMIYYAGHGIEVGGINYMIPVDAALRSDRDVPDETVSLESVLMAAEGARKLHLVVIDACRDNPFVPQMRRTLARRSVGRGLARIEPDGGTMVVYSAKEGQVAIDGDGRNSPFLLALLDQIKKPNIEINKLFRLVRDEVLTKTNHRQEPFVYGSLPAEDYYFVMK